jgi:hypothetical protein
MPDTTSTPTATAAARTASALCAAIAWTRRMRGMRTIISTVEAFNRGEPRRAGLVVTMRISALRVLQDGAASLRHGECSARVIKKIDQRFPIIR